MLKKNVSLAFLTLGLMIVNTSLLSQEIESKVEIIKEDKAQAKTTEAVPAAKPETAQGHIEVNIAAPALVEIPPEPTSIPTISYDCDDGASFAVEFSGSEILLILAGHGITLTKTPAASGVKYSDGTMTLSIDTEVAKLEEYGEILFKNCKAV